MDRKSINKLPPHVGPSVQIGDINGPQGSTNHPLPTQPSHGQGGYYTDVPVGGRDYDGPPGLSGSEHATESASAGVGRPAVNSIPHGDGIAGRTARGAADGGLPSSVFGPGNPNEPATSGRTGRGAADGGVGYPYHGGD